MDQTHRRSSPIEMSCLTCRRRRKECDEARRACERCTAGGFVYLGYDFVNEDTTETTPHESPNDSEPPTNAPTPHDTQFLRTAFSDNSSMISSVNSQDHTFVSTFRTPNVLIHSSFPAYLGGCSASARLKRGILINMYSRSTSLNPDSDSEANARQTTIPYPQSLAPIPTNVGRTIWFIVSHYEKLIDRSYVRPSYSLFAQFRDDSKWLLYGSKAFRVIKLLQSKMFETLASGTKKQKLDYYNRCITKVEQVLRFSAGESMTAVDPYERHSSLLELTCLKLIHPGGISSYRILQQMAPTFFQLASADPSLWTISSGPMSLAHILASPLYQLARFVLFDSVYSMVYALPQVIEYSTSIPLLPSKVNPTEWMYGCPFEFQFALVEINQRCNLLNRVWTETDWGPIEHRIRSWHPKSPNVSDKQSRKSIARLTIQESWRQTLLIYLYMAVGGVASDDSRVHTCVQQVFKLAGVVKQLEGHSIGAPFLVQQLIAGICTPYEEQRVETVKRLSAPPGSVVPWPLRGSELVSVLNHLWRGASAGGRAIRWSDYLHSRQTILPLVL